MSSDIQPKPPAHYSLALEVLKRCNAYELDLLAREVNVYCEAIRSCAGRTYLTAREVGTLFCRMHDVAVIRPASDNYVPQVPNGPVNLDEVAAQHLDHASLDIDQAIKRRVP